MRWNKSVVYNVLHKTTVTFLIGFSVISSGYLGYKGVYWFTGMNLFALCSPFCWLYVSNLRYVW